MQNSQLIDLYWKKILKKKTFLKIYPFVLQIRKNVRQVWINMKTFINNIVLSSPELDWMCFLNVFKWQKNKQTNNKSSCKTPTWSVTGAFFFKLDFFLNTFIKPRLSNALASMSYNATAVF